MDDILHVVTSLWPIVTGLAGAYGAVLVLFYRVSQLEKAFMEMATNDKVDHGTIAAKVDSLATSMNAFELRVVSQYVPKEDFNRTMLRVEAKLDALNDTILKSIGSK